MTNIFDKLGQPFDPEVFEAFLISLDLEREKVFGCYEKVYYKFIDTNIKLRVYTSLTEYGEPRRYGSDAIRVILLTIDDTKKGKKKEKIIKTSKRVNRGGKVLDIMERTLSRINELEEFYYLKYIP